MVGTTNLDGNDGTVYEVDYVQSHENYQGGLINDIGLVHVAQPIQFNDKVQAVAWRSPISEGTPVLTGWCLKYKNSGNRRVQKK